MTAPNRRRWFGPAQSARAITAWTTGLLLSAALPQYLGSSLVVEMRDDFVIGDAVLGTAIALSFGLSALISPVAGRALTRTGIRAGLLSSAAIVTVASIGLATIANSAAMVVALMALNGIGSGIASPSYSALLAVKVHSARHGTAFGLLTSAPQIAAFSGGLALPLVAEPLDWRVTFAAAAALGVVCALALESSGLPRAAVREPGEESPGPHPRPHASIWTLACATACMSAAGIGMRTFLVVFAVSIGLSDASAGFLLAASGGIALASRIGFGFLADKRGGDPLVQASWLMLLCALGLVMMAFGGTALAVVGAMLAGGLGWGWNAPLSLAIVTQNRAAVGAAVGIQMSGFYIGATVGPLAVGFLADHVGFETAWLVCAGSAVAGAAATMLARRQSRAPALEAVQEDFPLH